MANAASLAGSAAAARLELNTMFIENFIPIGDVYCGNRAEVAADGTHALVIPTQAGMTGFFWVGG